MQQNINYTRIAKAITYINNNFRSQPSLEQIAKEVHLSPHHFQRLFLDWAGVSPKKFIQYISVEYAKQLLLKDQKSIATTTYETGLSATSRLHDLFVNIEGMTPGEYKNGGQAIHINYSFSESPFGKLILAATPKGICHIAFYDNQTSAISTLIARFPNAHYQEQLDQYQKDALLIFQDNWTNLPQLKLHLKGTPFQLKVWEALLSIPKGQLSTYGALAKAIDKPKASRAVGTAIGKNPVAFLIPCHRVIQSSGTFGGYMWEPTRKAAIIGWEAAKLEQ